MKKFNPHEGERTHRLYFQKHFQSGLLKGLKVHAHRDFRSVEEAGAFGKDRKKKHKDLLTRDKWVVHDPTFQNTKR